jgi:sterol desaturase/sphingolipid hydroxylase (fatty acid hydroxylase superfamily)
MSLRKDLRSELEAPSELRKFGSGWIAGVLGFAFALGALLLVLIMRQTELFSTPELAALRQGNWFKPALMLVMLSAFLLGCLSLTLRPQKTLGFLAVVITLAASLLASLPGLPDLTGGRNVYFGLDFFILNVIFGGILFIPLERLFPKRPDQAVFRTEWREDLLYYFISSMFVQIFAFTTFAPSNFILDAIKIDGLRAWVAALPLIIQVVAIMIITDFVQYWLHRAFHRVPFLWGFHAVHHSAKAMDWIAGARMHFFEIIILRAATATPAFTLGFSQESLQVYLLIVYVLSTFVHANISWKLDWMERFMVTPRFHHWHHGIEKEAIDVNFAIHFPLYDKLFGTYHMPENRWPEGYGIGGHPVPTGYWQQFLYPFRAKI